MARYLSLYRRRPNVVDVNLQSGPGAFITARATALSYDFYIISTANLLTGSAPSWTLFQNVPASGGFMSTSIGKPGYNIEFTGEQFSQSRTPYLTRFRFAPSDYTTAFTTAGVSDMTPFWLSIVQHNIDGTTNTQEAPHLILPYSSQPNRTLLISGTASSDSPGPAQELQLPMQYDNFQIQNTSTSDVLQVAFEPNGSYWNIDTYTAVGLNLYETYPTASQIFVQGVGATVAFSLIAALRNNPHF